MKISTLALTLILFAAAIAVIVGTRSRIQTPLVALPSTNATSTVASSEPTSAEPPIQLESSSNALASLPIVTESPAEKPTLATNKLERLAQIRETFRALAAGDKLNAMRAAK